jgi:hypothetical protein
MSAADWTKSPATRAVAALACGSALLSGISLAGAVRERDQLPTAAHAFLEATIQASAVTACLQGARDELYLPGGQRIGTAIAAQAALRRLRSCDVDALASQLDEVHLPPAAPLTNTTRRKARADLVTGVSTLRRVVLDARGADVAMTREVSDPSDGTAVVLAYRSASAGSDSAYALAEQALELLGHPQSSPG